MVGIIWTVGIAAYLLALAAKRVGVEVWTVAGCAVLILITTITHTTPIHLLLLWCVYVLVALLLCVPFIRRHALSRWMLNYYLRVKPRMSKTESEAIQAGTVGWEAQIFTGKPDFSTLLAYQPCRLTEEEQAFMDGPVEHLCAMLDDWDICHNRADLPPAVWAYIKAQGFLGLIIPKAYGGKAFSAYAHSQIMTKIASVSVTASSYVGVPNSLGPAELLIQYGTEAQKAFYLPRLAQGIEVPCFALTGPQAGSDAGSMPDKGIICEGTYEGKTVMGIRLDWDKRYISLAPIATVIGLAFKLYDPNHLIGQKTDLGITCALIPAATKGITLGRRHLPMASPFQNGPIQGRDVFIPLDFIIGGIEMAGQGWKMLSECLAVGRAITLPAGAIGYSEMAVAASSAYATIRQQFKQPIGDYEGIQAALGESVGLLYIMNASRLLTLSMIDAGEHPGIVSAIVKYYTTEMGRQIAMHTMDIHGGKGICMGPRNYLARPYMTAPIGITVEGANILTRSMIIFGQGAIRCHPFVLRELSVSDEVPGKARLAAFDALIFEHLGFTVQNSLASLGYALTSSRGVFAAKGPLHRYQQHYTRLSTAFAYAVDLALMSLGADLKRREGISARFADALGYLYLASAVMKQYHDKNDVSEDKPLFEWSIQYLFAKVAKALLEIAQNLPNRRLGIKMKWTIFPLGNHFSPPNDTLTFQLATWAMRPSAARNALFSDCYLTPTRYNHVGKMEQVFAKQHSLVLLEKQLHRFAKQQQLTEQTFEIKLKAAVEAGWLTLVEAEALEALEKDRRQIIAVDDFAPEELVREIHLIDTEGQFVSGKHN